jgi:hypothetical protein
MGSARVQSSRFAVDVSPYCVWDPELSECNASFIASLDPEYFRYLAEAHGAGLRTESTKQHAALSLRACYAHGLETLFALLFAAIQAPDCVFGWLQRYKQADLRNLIGKVQHGKPLLSKADSRTFTWAALSDTIHYAFHASDEADASQLKRSYGNAWGRFAHDLTSEDSSLEYNGFKHGFRATAGGFSLSIGVEDDTGAAPPERMQVLGDGEYGSSFYVLEPITVKLHSRVMRYRLNWEPENYISGLYLISSSIHNIITYLRLVNRMAGGPPTYDRPADLSMFEDPWRRLARVTRLTTGVRLLPEQIQPFSKDEILAAYLEDSDKTQSK